MTARFEVWVADAYGVILDVIDEWIDLRYVRAVNDIGQLQLILDGGYPNFNVLKPDGRVYVIRNGRVETETGWFIRTLTKTLSQEGVTTITIGAVSAAELLTRRINAYDPDTNETVQENVKADNLMKYVVRNNFTTASVAARNWSLFSVEADLDLGPNVTKEMPYANVLDICQDISATSIQAGSAVYFDVVSPTLNTLEFRTYRGLRGIDNTFLSGFKPVVLAPERGNLANVVRTYDWANEYTYVYADGQWDLFTASSRDRIVKSPFGLRETYITVSGTSASLGIEDEAKAYLRTSRPVQTFSGELINIPGVTEYGVHWNWGDKVTVEFDDESFDATIDAVDINIRGGKETVQAKLRVAE